MNVSCMFSQAVIQWLFTLAVLQQNIRRCLDFKEIQAPASETNFHEWFFIQNIMHQVFYFLNNCITHVLRILLARASTFGALIDDGVFSW